MKKEEQINHENITLGEIKSKMRFFVEERDWSQFHTPRNLVMALTGEIGEVAEIFQWKGEIK